MSLEIRYLPRDPYTVHMVAHWLYSEWGYLLPGNTVEGAVERFGSRAESHRVPTCLVAYLDGEPVGTASLVNCDIPGLEHLTPWVGAVFVRPDCRSKGIGKELLRRMPEEWLKLGYRTAYLYTPDCVDFYRRMGWRVMEWRDYCDERVAIMRWEGTPLRSLEAIPGLSAQGAVGGHAVVSNSGAELTPLSPRMVTAGLPPAPEKNPILRA